tara:strand:- start:96 stop:551 length:456 start_codon:yes stop_codon:yes gene_type:complete
LEQCLFARASYGRVSTIYAKPKCSSNTKKKGEVARSEANVSDLTFDDLEALACGEIGLEIAYFWDLTPRQFSNIVTGYRNKEEAREKNNWYRARWQMYYSVVAMSGADKLKPEELLPFPWEEEEKIELNSTPKTAEEAKAFWDAIDKKKQQ